MFINNYYDCLFYTCVILLCHVGEGPVPTALVILIVIKIGSRFSREGHTLF